jgi:hypothetical protein
MRHVRIDLKPEHRHVAANDDWRVLDDDQPLSAGLTDTIHCKPLRPAAAATAVTAGISAVATIVSCRPDTSATTAAATTAAMRCVVSGSGIDTIPAYQAKILRALSACTADPGITRTTVAA